MKRNRLLAISGLLLLSACGESLPLAPAALSEGSDSQQLTEIVASLSDSISTLSTIDSATDNADVSEDSLPWPESRLANAYPDPVSLSLPASTRLDAPQASLPTALPTRLEAIGAFQRRPANHNHRH